MDIKQIFDFFLYAAECLVFIYYAQSFFQKKYSTLITTLLTSLGYLVLFLSYTTGDVKVNTIALISVHFLLFFFLYRCNVGTAFFHSTLLLILIAVTEWVVIFMITNTIDCDFYAFMDNLNIYVLVTVLNKLAYVLVVFVIVKLFSKKFKTNYSDPLVFALAIIPVTSGAVLMVLNQLSLKAEVSDSLALASALAALFLLFANIIVFVVYGYSITNANELNELRAEQQKAEIDKTYLEILEKNNADLKVFTHDLKNHLQLLENMSDDENLKNYVDEMYGSVDKFAYVGMSKNKVLDVIIGKYITLCEKENIDITFDVKTANLSFVKDTDLSAILNNLLDNAVRATKNSKEKKINLSVYSKNDVFQVLQVVNSCDEAPRSRGETLISTKDDKHNHGYGTKSVLRTAKKYDATFEWEYKGDEHEFEVLMVFPAQAN